MSSFWLVPFSSWNIPQWDILCATVSDKKDEDDKPLVQPTSVLKRESSAKRTVPTPLLAETDLQSGNIRLPHWNKMCQESRVSEQKTSRVWAKIQMVKPSRELPTSCRMIAT